MTRSTQMTISVLLIHGAGCLEGAGIRGPSDCPPGTRNAVFGNQLTDILGCVPCGPDEPCPTGALDCPLDENYIDAGGFCISHTRCAPDEVEWRAPTVTTDRVCVDCVPDDNGNCVGPRDCQLGVTYEARTEFNTECLPVTSCNSSIQVLEPTLESDRVCSTCSPGQHRYPGGDSCTQVDSADLDIVVPGENFACALRAGQIECWGRERGFKHVVELTGDYDMLEIEDDVACGRRVDTRQLECVGSTARESDQGFPSEPVRAVSLGDGRFCAILDNTNLLRCWSNLSEQGFGTPNAVRLAQSVSVAGLNACAVPVGGGLAHCWGESALAPPPVDLVMVAMREAAACGVRSMDSAPECWGEGRVVDTVVDVPLRDIALTLNAACGITRDSDELVCWGVSGPAIRDAPYGVAIATLESSETSFCALTAEGRAVCWGDDDDAVASGVPGNPFLRQSFQSLELGLGACLRTQEGTLRCAGGYATWDGIRGESFTDLDVDGSRFCGVSELGDLRCWTNDEEESASLTGDYRAVAVGGITTCAITTPTGALECSGWPNSLVESTPPGRGFVAVEVASRDYACAIDGEGLRCFGPQAPESARFVPGAFRVVSVGDVPCVINESSEVRCFGDASVAKNAPVGSGVVSLAVDGGGGCAVFDTGVLECWSRSAPSSRPFPDDDIRVVAVDGLTRCALRRDGTLFCWGDTVFGR